MYFLVRHVGVMIFYLPQNAKTITKLMIILLRYRNQIEKVNVVRNTI